MHHLSNVLLCVFLASCSITPSAESVGYELADVTSHFLATLDDAQRELALQSVDDNEALAWHFVPGRYAGIEMGALNAQQHRAAHQVLRTMLSATGFAKAMAIADLENVLHALESKPNKPATHRDPDRYALLVSGTPSPNGTYVVRYQGHHVSLRMVVVNGMLVAHTPHFLGTNPHIVPAEFARPAVLQAEESRARELLDTFNAADLQKAIIAAKAPADVLLGPGKAPSELDQALRGLGWSEMSELSRHLLQHLLEVHAKTLRPDVAAAELERIYSNREEISFAWAGSTEPGKGHYYRILGKDFAIEYDCTQNDANHVHVCWRDFENDFGGDAFIRHLKEQHGR